LVYYDSNHFYAILLYFLDQLEVDSIGYDCIIHYLDVENGGNDWKQEAGSGFEWNEWID
jgi:hypothetical protein